MSASTGSPTLRRSAASRSISQENAGTSDDSLMGRLVSLFLHQALRFRFRQYNSLVFSKPYPNSAHNLDAVSFSQPLGCTTPSTSSDLPTTTPHSFRKLSAAYYRDICFLSTDIPIIGQHLNFVEEVCHSSDLQQAWKPACQPNCPKGQSIFYLHSPSLAGLLLMFTEDEVRARIIYGP